MRNKTWIVYFKKSMNVSDLFLKTYGFLRHLIYPSSFILCFMEFKHTAQLSYSDHIGLAYVCLSPSVNVQNQELF